MYFCEYFVSLLFMRLIPGGQFVDSNVLCIWNIDVNGQSTPQNEHFHQKWCWCLFSHILTLTEYYLLSLFLPVWLRHTQCYIIVLMICISLVFPEIEYVLCSYWPLTFPPINCLFIYTWPIFTVSDWFVWVLYKLKALALCGELCKYFPEFVICLYDKFFRQKCFIFI